MPSTDRKPELKAKTSVAQTRSQPFVYAKGLMSIRVTTCFGVLNRHLQASIWTNGVLYYNATPMGPHVLITYEYT
jgi:hypothetical protein